MKQHNWVRSRFNAISSTKEGELLLYNSYTGAISAFPDEEREEVMASLKGHGIINTELTELQQQMLEMGFIIPSDVDEERRAQFLFQAVNRTDVLHLSILTTEACNFRCVYCYGDFVKGKMPQDIIEGLKRYVQNQARTLRHLSISWFGGEPLAASDVIGELSESFIEICAQWGIEYSAEILTNGYFLKPKLFAKLDEWQIKRYMITLDGPEEIHNARRNLIGEGGSFQVILNNLLEMKKTEKDFEVALRVNFDNDNLPYMDELIDIFAEHFAHDRRFQTYFRPVGRMGGKNDAHLPICDDATKDKMIWELTQTALDRGVAMSSIVENALMPLGSTCYCVKPNAFVVGSDGGLYKCSVAFDEPINQLGKVLPDGTFDLDYDKYAYWVTPGPERDKACDACFFRPSCNGNHCKLYRMRNDERPCSFEKKEIKKVLETIYQDHTLV